MTPSEIMALFAALLILFVLGWCGYMVILERRQERKRSQRYPEAKLTTKVDRTIIKMYLDEHEERIS